LRRGRPALRALLKPARSRNDTRIPAHRGRLITEENARWWTLGAMCFALFMIMLDNTVVDVALPSIQRDLV
jgi:hypothetical protein